MKTKRRTLKDKIFEAEVLQFSRAFGLNLGTVQSEPAGFVLVKFDELRQWVQERGYVCVNTDAPSIN